MSFEQISFPTSESAESSEKRNREKNERRRRKLSAVFATFLSLGPVKDTEFSGIDVSKNPNNFGAGAEQSLTNREVSSENRAELMLKKKESIKNLSSAKSAMDLERIVSESSVDTRDGKVFLLDDESVVLTEDIVAAIRHMEEGMYDGVEHLSVKNLSEVGENFAGVVPNILRHSDALRNRLMEVLKTEAKVAYAYSHPVNYGEGRLPSILQFEVGDVPVSLRTLDARFFGGGDLDSEASPILFSPGFATTAATYERMAVNLLMHGHSVVVPDAQRFDVDMSGKDSEFGDLPTLPQAYATIMQESIKRTVENFGTKVDLVTYSFGSAATAAVAENPEKISSLTMISPAGLYPEGIEMWSRKADLIRDTLTIHGSQVKDMAGESERNIRLHEDISHPVDERLEKEFGNPLAVNAFKIRSSFDAIEFDLGALLKKLPKDMPVTIFAGKEDAFFPSKEIRKTVGEFSSSENVKVYELDWSHSSMKYHPEEATDHIENAINIEH